MDVARRALCLCMSRQARGRACSARDVVRAALLHDIGMTEDDVFRMPAPVKAYVHPRRSAEIAVREFQANPVQADAILHHMWPVLTGRPGTAEGWILIAADKRCAMREVTPGGRGRP